MSDVYPNYPLVDEDATYSSSVENAEQQPNPPTKQYDAPHSNSNRSILNGSLRKVLNARDQAEMDMEAGKRQHDKTPSDYCICIKATVLALALSFLFCTLKLGDLVWCALASLQTPTDYATLSIDAVQILLCLAYFANYKTVNKSLCYLIIWILMLLLVLGEIGVYCIAVFVDKKLEIVTTNGETKQVFQKPPIWSTFIGLLFTGTMMRVWLLCLRLERANKPPPPPPKPNSNVVAKEEEEKKSKKGANITKPKL